MLAVPLAANVGGMGTPIGTPPNAIAMKYLTGADTVSFGSWMGVWHSLGGGALVSGLALAVVVALSPGDAPRAQHSTGRGAQTKARSSFTGRFFPPWPCG